jgi:hypothetical protein
LQEDWDEVVSFNPAGMTAMRPTVACTYARMDMPELELTPDGQVLRTRGVARISFFESLNLTILTLN